MSWTTAFLSHHQPASQPASVVFSVFFSLPQIKNERLYVKNRHERELQLCMLDGGGAPLVVVKSRQEHRSGITFFFFFMAAGFRSQSPSTSRGNCTGVHPDRNPATIVRAKTCKGCKEHGEMGEGRVRINKKPVTRHVPKGYVLRRHYGTSAGVCILYKKPVNRHVPGVCVSRQALWDELYGVGAVS